MLVWFERLHLHWLKMTASTFSLLATVRHNQTYITVYIFLFVRILHSCFFQCLTKPMGLLLHSSLPSGTAPASKGCDSPNKSWFWWLSFTNPGLKKYAIAKFFDHLPIWQVKNKNMRLSCHHLCASKNRGTPKSSILIRFSIINHPFWGTPISGNIHLEILFGAFHSLGIFLRFFKTWEERTANGGP